jgi:hypothetical protein
MIVSNISSYEVTDEREYTKAEIAIWRHRIAVRGAQKLRTITLLATSDYGELGPDIAC